MSIVTPSIKVGQRLYVRIWSGSASCWVCDMTDAGKRGRKCRVLRITGSPSSYGYLNDPTAASAAQWTQEALYCAERLSTETSFDDARGQLQAIVANAHAAGVPVGHLQAYDEEIRAVDAPKPSLTAGVEGKWSAGADERGIRLHALDDVNEWTESTHGQAESRAYAIAAKVWPQVEQALTLYEAATILRQAGARLHGYCGLD